MKRVLIGALVLTMVWGLLPAMPTAQAQGDAQGQVPYAQFLQYYQDFLIGMNAKLYKREKAFKVSLKKVGKDGRMPFSITGPEGGLSGFLVGDLPDGKYSNKESGLVDSFTLTLKYPGGIMPVLAAISALSTTIKMSEYSRDILTNKAYRQVNPDSEGRFQIPEYQVEVTKKTKDGMASHVSFTYLPGARPDASAKLNLDSMELSGFSRTTVPVDVEGFVRRVNFWDRSRVSNMQTARFTPLKFKKGKPDTNGGFVPYTFKNREVTITIQGDSESGVVQQVTYLFGLSDRIIGQWASLYAFLYGISGFDNSSGLVTYPELDWLAVPFGGEYYPIEWPVMPWEITRTSLSYEDLKTVLESQPINGYKVECSMSEDEMTVEYTFTLLDPSAGK